MPIRKLNPYLNFEGDAAKAIALYEKALGAKTLNVQRFGDAPPMPGSPPLSVADKKRVLHATIEVGGCPIMMSDTPPGQAVQVGDNTHISLDYTNLKEMQKAFAALGKGGKVTMPIMKQFWGAHFGMVTDAFGIHWMVNCEE